MPSALASTTPDSTTGRVRNLLFGLAHACDARGDYAEAAACLERANALALNQRIKQNRVYNPAEHSRFVDRLIEGFTPELFDRLAGAGDDTRQPVFVFGMPRSGTTLVEQVLASHTRVHGAGELRLVRQMFDAIPGVVGRDDGLLPCLTALDAAGVYELGRRSSIEPSRDPRARPPRLRSGPDRGQDAGQLPLSRPARPRVPASDLDPRPPRPEGRGAVVLDDQFPQHSLGQRPGAPGRPLSANTTA